MSGVAPPGAPASRASIRLCVLGPLAVERDGAAVRIGADKVRLLAAALGATAPAGLRPGELATALWGDDPPRSARKTIQTYVSQLRRLLGPTVVATEPWGYRLGPDVLTDAAEFEEAVSRALAEPDPGSGATIAARALGLWRGDPVPELEDWDAALGIVRRLHELHSRAEELRADALIRSGRYDDAIAELEVLVADEPFRERRWELLMVGLVAVGRRTEALRAYQRAFTTLVEQAGVAPGPALRDLERSILEDSGDPVDSAVDLLGSSSPSESHVGDGDEARSRGDLAGAVLAYRRALSEANRTAIPVARQCTVLIRLAEVEYLTGDPHARSTAIAAARLADHLDDEELLVGAAVAAARQIDAAATRTDPDRVATLRRAVGAARTPAARARTMAVLASELNAAPDHAERRRLSDEALAIGRDSGEAEVLHAVLAARAGTIRAPDTLGERLDITAEDLRLTAGGDPRHRWGAHSNRALTCLDAGLAAEAEQHDRSAGELADELQLPAMVWRARLTEARDLARAGDLAAAEARAEEARRIGRAAGEDAAAAYGAQLYLIRYEQGRVHELARHLAARPLISALDRAFVCHASMQLDRRDDAAGLLAGLAARRFGDVPFDGQYLTVLTLAADVAAALGDEAAMSELDQLLEPWQDQCAASAATFLGTVAHPRAVLAAGLGRIDDADAAFRAATAGHVRCRAPLLDARLHLEWGRFLAELEPGEARGHLERAASAADRLHAPAIVTGASAALDRLAAISPSPP